MARVTEATPDPPESEADATREILVLGYWGLLGLRLKEQVGGEASRLQSAKVGVKVYGLGYRRKKA